MKYIKYVVGCLILPVTIHAYELTNLTRNDPFSFYTTRYRYEFLLTGLKYELFSLEPYPHEKIRFTVTPFRQAASDDIVLDPNNLFPNLMATETLPFPAIKGCPDGRDFKKRKVPLGDIKGRLNMLALFYDNLNPRPPLSCPPQPTAMMPTAKDFINEQKKCPTVQYFYRTLDQFINPEQPSSQQRFDTLFPTMAQQELITCTCIPLLIDEARTDTTQRLGFFTIPLDYKKNGVRFDFDWNLCNDFDIELNVGFAEIKQHNQYTVAETLTTVTGVVPVMVPRSNTEFIDLSCFAPIITCTDQSTGETCTLFGVQCTCLEYLNDFLMRKLDKIADELCLDIDDFCITGFEDIRLGLHWHHTYAACPDQHGHPLYLFTPFVLVEGSIPTADIISNRKILGLPLGNNGHGAVGFAAGFNFDYNGFFSVGLDAGMTNFAGRTYNNLPMPTDELQAVFFPFSVDACIRPGRNWHASASLLYSEIYYRLSIFTQYLYVNHAKDRVTILRDLRLTQPVLEGKLAQFNALGGYASLPPFLPELYERESKWDAQSLIFGFNYDFCDNLGLGFLWQTPLSGRRTYDVSTLVFTFSAVF